MKKRTAKQEALFRKAFDGVPLSADEKLAIFGLSFSDRSTLSMVATARRRAVESGQSAGDWRQCA